jgi:hypothetical protein
LSTENIKDQLHNIETPFSVRNLQVNQNITKTVEQQNLNSNSYGNVKIPESSKIWVSNLEKEQRNQYESMLEKKNSFKISLFFLPKTFRPDDTTYQRDVQKVVILFLAIATLITILILVFLILRFGFKKCLGPTKSSHVTRGYRNVTWLVMSKSFLK